MDRLATLDPKGCEELGRALTHFAPVAVVDEVVVRVSAGQVPLPGLCCELTCYTSAVCTICGHHVSACMVVFGGLHAHLETHDPLIITLAFRLRQRGSCMPLLDCPFDCHANMLIDNMPELL